MPEADTRDEKQFHEDIPAVNRGFFLKGSDSYDWGMKNRLAHIFRPSSGRTVMLAIDHGYFQGPTSGLERVDLSIVPIAPYADALMLTRGMLRTTIPPSTSGVSSYGRAEVRRSSRSCPTSRWPWRSRMRYG